MDDDVHVELGNNRFELRDVGAKCVGDAEVDACNGVDVDAIEPKGGAYARDVGGAEVDAFNGVDAVDA